MKKFIALLSMVFLAGLFSAASVFADVDTPDFSDSMSPQFTLTDKAYDHFETEVKEIGSAINNLIITTEANKTESAVIKSFARFRYSDSGKWTRYMAFDGEYHFSAIETVSAYQLLFVIRDTKKGTTTLQNVYIQGNFIEPEKMAWVLQQPEEFEPKVVWAKPAVVSRSTWGARPPKSGYSQHSPQRIVVHHSFIPNQSQYRGAASIRGIQNYHMDDPRTKWSDIGYHFLIGPEGTIYQGRPETVVGAHCAPNTNAVGICLIGDYDPDKDTLTPASERALLNLMSWLASNYRINPETNIFGHCDYSTKSCPGATVYQKLPTFKNTVKNNIK